MIVKVNQVISDIVKELSNQAINVNLLISNVKWQNSHNKIGIKMSTKKLAYYKSNSPVIGNKIANAY